MDRETRKSGLKLALAGVLGALFFWVTDPVRGPFRTVQARDNPVDALNEAFVGTTVGIVGSAVVLLFGLWIASRRT